MHAAQRLLGSLGCASDFDLRPPGRCGRCFPTLSGSVGAEIDPGREIAAGKTAHVGGQIAIDGALHNGARSRWQRVGTSASMVAKTMFPLWQYSPRREESQSSSSWN
jgi:hypothetical protein